MGGVTAGPVGVTDGDTRGFTGEVEGVLTLPLRMWMAVIAAAGGGDILELKLSVLACTTAAAAAAVGDEGWARGAAPGGDCCCFFIMRGDEISCGDAVAPGPAFGCPLDGAANLGRKLDPLGRWPWAIFVWMGGGRRTAEGDTLPTLAP